MKTNPAPVPCFVCSSTESHGLCRPADIRRTFNARNPRFGFGTLPAQFAISVKPAEPVRLPLSPSQIAAVLAVNANGERF